MKLKHCTWRTFWQQVTDFTVSEPDWKWFHLFLHCSGDKVSRHNSYQGWSMSWWVGDGSWVLQTAGLCERSLPDIRFNLTLTCLQGSAGSAANTWLDLPTTRPPSPPQAREKSQDIGARWREGEERRRRRHRLEGAATLWLGGAKKKPRLNS